jgi:integrase
MGVWRRSEEGLKKPFYFQFQTGGKTIRRGGFASKTQAVVAEEQERVRQSSILNSPSFGWVANERLKEVAMYATAAHYRDVRTILSRFEEWYGIPIALITVDMAKTRFFEIAKKFGNRYANRHLIELKAVFNWAVRNNHLTKSLINVIIKLAVKDSSKQIPERSDIEKVFDVAHPLDRAYLEVILFTAARVNEINTLRWADVDLLAHTLKLWTSKKKHGDRKFRVIPMIPRVHEALIEAWNRRPEDSVFVFNNPDMVMKYPHNPERWAYGYRSKLMTTLCKKAGVARFTYHEMRHNSASILADRGVPITVIQAILGHESIVTTNRYLHALGKAMIDGMDALA